MTDTRPNRRHILKKAGALGALAALFSPSVALAQTTTGNTQSLEGGWRTTITLQGNSPFQGLITFDAGGGHTCSRGGYVFGHFLVAEKLAP